MKNIGIPTITIATSIAPNGDLLNQKAAINSWLTLGFSVVSINTIEEIAVCKPYFPDIEFVAATRDARSNYVRPYIYFDDLLNALTTSGSRVCGIVNSDIHLLQPGLYPFIYKEALHSFVFGARIDVDTLENKEQGSLYQGFDYFFFDKEVISHYPQEEFCIGLPWWDYWAVLIPMAHKIPIKKIITPIAYHLRHTPGNLDVGSWIPLGFTLAKYVSPPFSLSAETMASYQPLLFQFIDRSATAISFKNTSFPISVVVHTLNEERNIRNCLECVKWADEILVIDMFSDDSTVEIARQYTDKIFTHERCRYVEPARQFALEQTSYDWVLVVDADELVTPALRDTLIRLVDENKYDVVFLPRANYLFGHMMKGSGRGAKEDYQLRFFNKNFIRYTNQIHQIPIIVNTARVQYLTDEQHALVHFNYIDIEQYLEKLNRYTTIEAESDYLSGKKFNLQTAWKNSIEKISAIVIDKEGFERDGVYGLGLGMLMAMYHFTAALKLLSMEEYDNINPGKLIHQQYQAIADEIIKQYEKE